MGRDYEFPYLIIMVGLMATGSVVIQTTPREELQQYSENVMTILIPILIIHFIIRIRMIRARLSPYISHMPIKSPRYRINNIVRLTHAIVFYYTEVLSITIMALYVITLGLGIGDEYFPKLQVWELVASFAVYPYLGQIIPWLMKHDEKHHKESQEKAGLYYEGYY